MANYKGHFMSIKNNPFVVRLIADKTSSTYTDVLLAGNNPFTVEYNTSSTPFEPVRTSVATIRIVHNTYLEDILPSKPQDTQVVLYNEKSMKVVWSGYLTPKVYDQDYRDEYEEVELEAADCLSALQYFDYENEGSTKGIVTFHSILKQICEKVGLDGFVWAKSKKIDGTYVFPTELKISERNFYSDDTDEPWKLSEVLEEMCRYVGFTAIQWGQRLYLVDYQAFHNNDRLLGTNYLKSSSYNKGTDVYMDNSTYTITAESYMASDATISFKPIYNKVTVNANFYDAEDFIPNIFDDKFLTNRIDDKSFYENYEVEPEVPNKAQFPKTLRVSNTDYDDDVPDKKSNGDADYRYFHRLYNHKYWESVYHTAAGADASPSEATQKTKSIVRDYMGGTIVDLGVVRKEHSSEYQQWIVPNKLDYTRYLCLCCKYSYDNYNYYRTNFTPQYNGPFYMFKLKDGYSSPCVLSENSFLVIDYSIIWERYKNRAYINPDWKTDAMKVGGLQSGGSFHAVGNLSFVLKIGNKWWDGRNWVEYYSAFRVECEKTSKQNDYWNEELHVLNNISWDLFVNESGYKIPLEGVDTTQAVEFYVLRPSPQFAWNSGSNKFHTEYEWNAYCWVKDLSIKCVQGGQDAEQVESDVVYKNVIDEESVNELSEISVKFTTYTNMTKPSYSNVILFRNGVNKLLSSITESSLSGNAQKPEENIIEKYVLQYNHPTKQFSIPLDLTVTPFTKVFYADVNDGAQGYCVLGTSIDYSMETQTINLEEKK